MHGIINFMSERCPLIMNDENKCLCVDVCDLDIDTWIDLTKFCTHVNWRKASVGFFNEQNPLNSFKKAVIFNI